MNVVPKTVALCHFVKFAWRSSLKASLLPLLCCPDCSATLSLVSAREKNAEIVSGTLRCKGCDSSFPIEDGLPVILRSDIRSEPTRQSFGKQWKLHEQRRFEQ